MGTGSALVLHRNNLPVMFRSIYWATLPLPSFQAWENDSASEHNARACETFRRARGLLLPFYCSNRPRSPALSTVDANFGDRLHFGGFAQTGTTKARKMGDKQLGTCHLTRRTLAAEDKTLEANSNFPRSENKPNPEKGGNNERSHVVM
jgi:hypothetical protein